MKETCIQQLSVNSNYFSTLACHTYGSPQFTYNTRSPTCQKYKASFIMVSCHPHSSLLIGGMCCSSLSSEFGIANGVFSCRHFGIKMDGCYKYLVCPPWHKEHRVYAGSRTLQRTLYSRAQSSPGHYSSIFVLVDPISGWCTGIIGPAICKL